MSDRKFFFPLEYKDRLRALISVLLSVSAHQYTRETNLPVCWFDKKGGVTVGVAIVAMYERANEIEINVAPGYIYVCEVLTKWLKS